MPVLLRQCSHLPAMILLNNPVYMIRAGRHISYIQLFTNRRMVSYRCYRGRDMRVVILVCTGFDQSKCLESVD